MKNLLQIKRAAKRAKEGGRFSAPAAFLLLWAYVGIGRPQDIFFFLRPLRLALLSIGLTFLAAFTSPEGLRNRDIFRYREARIFIAFLAWIMVTIVFGHNRRMGFNFFVYYYAVNAAFFFAVTLLVNEISHIKALVWVLILSAFGLAAASLALSASQRISVEGGANDPNDLALLFISTLPMIVYLIPKETGLKRVFLIISFVVTVTATVFTYSRGGFLGLIMVSILILTRRSGFRNNALKFFAVGAAAAAFLFLAPDSFWERIGSIGDEMHVDTTDEHHMFSRQTIWKEGFSLLLENPVAGVGFGAFADALAHFRLESGGIPKYQTAHNSFVLVATETGIIGFILYSALVVSALATFRKVRKTATDQNSEISTYANMLEVSMLGWMVCAFFLSQAYSSHFLLFPALAAVIRENMAPAVCREKAETRPSPARKLGAYRIR